MRPYIFVITSLKLTPILPSVLPLFAPNESVQSLVPNTSLENAKRQKRQVHRCVRNRNK